MSQLPVSGADLAALESLVADGLARQDSSGLNVLGFGEISVALGWPIDEPTHVCKRTPPFTPAQFAQYESLVNSYIARLRDHGLAVVDTTVMRVDRGDRVVGYLVQPLLDTNTLGNKVLAAAEPDPDHPFLAAVINALDVVGPQLSIDAQVTNFAWDGTTLTLIDVGTPFVWDGDGNLAFDMGPFLKMIPAVVRPLVKRDMTRIINRWQEPRRVAVDIVANLYREGLTDWVEPALRAFNRDAHRNHPISRAEALAIFDDDAKTFPRLKKLQAAERTWQTSIRRRPYDFFIHSTYAKAGH
jgi:hypothetical protein